VSISFWVASVFAGTLQTAEIARPFTPEDVFALEAIAAPQISPNGDWVAYVRRSNDEGSDQTQSNVWLSQVDGSQQRSLTPRDATSSAPLWAPDGESFVYILQTADGTSLVRHDPASGRQTQLTRIDGGLNDLTWSPDGSMLAFVGFVGGAAPQPANLGVETDEERWAARAQVEDRLVFRLDGFGTLPYGDQQVYIIDANSGRITPLPKTATSSIDALAWEPGNRSLIVSADRRERDTDPPNSELYRIDLIEGGWMQLTNRLGPDTAPAVSPDGRYIAYLGFDDRRMGYHNTQLSVLDTQTGEHRLLSADLDRSVANPQWASDSQAIYIQYEDSGDTVVARIHLDGRLEPLVGGLGDPVFGRPYTGGSYSVAADGTLAITGITATRPAELFVGTAELGFAQLTDVNSDALAGIHISDAEEIHFNSPHDGLEIEGWVLYPPDFDPGQQYPLILEIHGGPFSGYGPVFSAEFQLMAAAGYVVVYTNPRGSSGYGAPFANEIHHAYPGNDHDDLMGAIDYMLDRGFIDPERLFITGGSGGGTLTAWAIGTTDRFAAAAVVKPVINWSSFVLNSDLPPFFLRYWFENPPWEDPEEYWRRSPLSLVGNVETPTLVMVGGADIRTPSSEAEQYYTALRVQDVPTAFVTIPDSFHGISNSRPSRLLTKVAEILRWFETHDPAHEDAAQ